jgi:transposase-like protein
MIIWIELRNLLRGTIQSIHETEMDDHLGYKAYERSECSNV